MFYLFLVGAKNTGQFVKWLSGINDTDVAILITIKSPHELISWAKFVRVGCNQRVPARKVGAYE